MNKAILSRFFDKVFVTDSCHIWTGSTTPYGRFRLNGKLEKAHRLAYKIRNGQIPPDMYVCHHCDVPECVNPDHLFLGTHADNMLDMYAKGRRKQFGENAGNSKLTEEQVRLIRSDDRTGVAIALQYGVTQSTISLIRKRKAWSHI